MSPIRLVIALVAAFAFAPIPEQAPGDDAPVKRASPPSSPLPLPGPKAEMTPEQVVEAQLIALQFNDRPTKDAGIATTFRFASPGNQKMTGPVEKFAMIVRGPAFQPLINHRIAGYGLLVVKDTLALQRVTVIAEDGKAVDYEFRLSKDPDTGCWGTDGVIPIPSKPPIDPNKFARSSQSPLNESSAPSLHPL